MERNGWRRVRAAKIAQVKGFLAGSGFGMVGCNAHLGLTLPASTQKSAKVIAACQSNNYWVERDQVCSAAMICRQKINFLEGRRERRLSSPFFLPTHNKVPAWNR